MSTYNTLHALFHSAREYLNPILKNSKFAETGVLTPEEFVLAGDFLVYKCPTWSWASGEPSKRRDYLPADKQYLITRNVPCLRRVRAMEYAEEDLEQLLDEGGDTGGAWVATHGERGAEGAEAFDMDEPDESGDDASKGEGAKVGDLEGRLAAMSAAGQEGGTGAGDSEEDAPDMDDIPDMDAELVGAIDEEEDPAADDSQRCALPRTYDMSITYDKYYQTPRVWLFGYDEQRHPLTSPQIFEDISQDHAKKTVTIESHPHENVSLASIHPCKHANVMKKIIDHLVESGKTTELRVDQYLLLFLKFMSSVLPTMDYDCKCLRYWVER
ncbi:autophagocytosis associated protein [Blyttiomyces helicus]|uniref:Autophagy-related protein 3 n=1 Tax=Blyttiomyces helicus TaxID=388810 RepID=A0A4V1ISD8_9FUNG|nr:autophagocytosis associated protein [Blyttiomyces helicus]|eukprot:RKO93207.1 autophagocytosis associated protein [Blyttiomyces helicus]